MLSPLIPLLDEDKPRDLSLFDTPSLRLARVMVVKTGESTSSAVSRCCKANELVPSSGVQEGPELAQEPQRSPSLFSCSCSSTYLFFLIFYVLIDLDVFVATSLIVIVLALPAGCLNGGRFGPAKVKRLLGRCVEVIWCPSG